MLPTDCWSTVFTFMEQADLGPTGILLSDYVHNYAFTCKATLAAYCHGHNYFEAINDSPVVGVNTDARGFAKRTFDPKTSKYNVYQPTVNDMLTAIEYMAILPKYVSRVTWLYDALVPPEEQDKINKTFCKNLLPNFVSNYRSNNIRLSDRHLWIIVRFAHRMNQEEQLIELFAGNKQSRGRPIYNLTDNRNTILGPLKTINKYPESQAYNFLLQQCTEFPKICYGRQNMSVGTEAILFQRFGWTKHKNEMAIYHMPGWMFFTGIMILAIISIPIIMVLFPIAFLLIVFLSAGQGSIKDFLFPKDDEDYFIK